MRWPWRRETGPIEPSLTADLKVLELETAKEILAESSVPGPARWRR